MRFRPKVAVQALHHCLGRSGSPTMDARRAFLAIAVACAAAQRWCDANLFAPPRPAIELPMELAHAGGVATQTVFEVRRGDRIDDASLAFAHAWRLGDAQLERLRKAAHDAVKTGAVVPSAVAVVSDDGRHAAWAAAGGAVVALLRGGADPPAASDCAAAASAGAAGFGFVDAANGGLGGALRDAAAAAPPGAAVVVLAVAADPPSPSLHACLAAHARAGYARGDPGGALVLAAPSPNGGGDAALVFPRELLDRWWAPVAAAPWATEPAPSDVEAALFAAAAHREGAFLRAWALVAAAVADERPREDAADEGEAGPLVDCGGPCPGFVVVVYQQGPSDTSTSGTFAEISASLVAGLRGLGLAARAETCVALTDGCRFALDGEQEVALGAHNLQAYVDVDAGAPVILGPRRPLFYDEAAVLYNFEYVPPDDLETLAAGMAQLQSGARGDGGLTNAAGSFATAATLEVLRRANTVWDYSASNVPSLAALGISATHVPLGDAPPWRIGSALAAAVSANASSSIPVLFYGTLTRHRAATLAAIRAGPNGQPVVHANAATDGTFGAALDAQIAAADVVLNLRAFGDRDDEWKMPRLAKLFANRKFVIYARRQRAAHGPGPGGRGPRRAAERRRAGPAPLRRRLHVGPGAVRPRPRPRRGRRRGGPAPVRGGRAADRGRAPGLPRRGLLLLRRLVVVTGAEHDAAGEGAVLALALPLVALAGEELDELRLAVHVDGAVDVDGRAVLDELDVAPQ